MTLAIDYLCIPKIFILYIRGALSLNYLTIFQNVIALIDNTLRI